MKRRKNEENPFASGDPARTASMMPDAVSRSMVSEEEYQKAVKVSEVLESGDRNQAENLMSRQVSLAEKTYPKPKD